MADYDHAARLEPFLLLARSTKGAAAVKVISDATAAPGVYIFGELLALPGISSLASDANLVKSHQLLELFAYGTLESYSANKDSYPPLSPAHLVKLQHLTLVSLALQRRALPYDDLLAALQIDSVRALEDLIIDVIYSGLLAGKMHHNERVLHIDWVAGRDVSPRDLPVVQQRLEDWCTTAQHLLTALDARIAEVRSSASQESAALAAYKAFRNEQYYDAQKDKDAKKESKQWNNQGGGGSSGRNASRDAWGQGGSRDEYQPSAMDMDGGAGAGGSGSGGGSGGGKGPGIAQRLGNRLGGMMGDDKRGRGSKRQRDL